MDPKPGGEAMVQQLQREGAEVVFGIPGAQIMGLYDALYDAPSISVITTRHEQGAAYMADGYARVTGRPGVLTTVPGPGVYNACAGLATAYACSYPVLLLAGQISRALIGEERGVLHEVHDQLEVVRPVTKWATRALHADDLGAAVHEAYRQMGTGRARPTHIEFPPEALAEPTSTPPTDSFKPVRTPPEPDTIARAAEILARSSSPIIIAGGGAVSANAYNEVNALAVRLQAPVLVTREGKAAIDNRHPLFVGSLWANTRRLRPVIDAADVIIAIGTRLEGVAVGAHHQVIRIDADERNAAVSSGVAICADAAIALTALVEELASLSRKRESRTDEAKTHRVALEDRLRAFGTQADIVDALRGALPDDTVIAGGTTTVGYMCHAYFPVHAPRSYLATSYMGTLGFSLSMGIGAKIGAPDRPVVTVSGDGGFLFGATELATAAQYGANTINIVFNDEAYGNPNREQRDEWDGREIGTVLRNPDFVAFAASFGADSVRVKTADALAGAVREALGNNRPTVIEFPHERMPYVMRDPGEAAPVRRARGRQ